MQRQISTDQWTIVNNEDTYLLTWIDAFLVDRKAQGFSKGTIYFYKKKLELFTKFCDGQIIKHIPEITATSIREYLIWLEQSGHNSGGIHACYRALKTFLYWWEDEIEPEGWRIVESKFSPVYQKPCFVIYKKQKPQFDMI